MGGSWARKIQMGRESTAGTAVAASTVWRGVGEHILDERTTEFVREEIGTAMPTLRTYVPRLLATLNMAATPATFEQLLHLLEAGIETITPVQDGAGSDYISAYGLSSAAVGTLKTYTLESGDNVSVEEMEYGTVQEIVLSGVAGESVMMSGKWFGRQATVSAFTGALSAPTVDEILAYADFYIDDAGGSFGGTQVTGTLREFTLTINTGRLPRFTVDSGQKYFYSQIFDVEQLSWTLDLTYEHDAVAAAEKVDWRAEAARLMRLDFTGPAVTTPGTTYSNKLLRLDVAGKYETISELQTDEGNTIVKASLRGGYESTSGGGLDITVVHELSAIP